MKKVSQQAQKRKLKLLQSQKISPRRITNIFSRLKCRFGECKSINTHKYQQFFNTTYFISKGDSLYFLNIHSKCMNPKSKLNNGLSDVICDKDLATENEISCETLRGS